MHLGKIEIDRVSDPQIIVALDVSTSSELRKLVAQISNTHCRVKIGKELFTSVGPEAIEICHKEGLEVFLDLKFHDIPSTCAKAVRAAARWGVWMLNVHCSGGTAMMQAAREAIDAETNHPKLVGVTVLTSMTEISLRDIGVNRSLEGQVDSLASQAQAAGLDGVVCSGQEASRLRQACGNEFCLVTPGVRPSWCQSHDQMRVVTPKEAIAYGSDYLVIGRPITASNSPASIIESISSELASYGIERDF